MEQTQANRLAHTARQHPPKEVTLKQLVCFSDPEQVAWLGRKSLRAFKDVFWDVPDGIRDRIAELGAPMEGPAAAAQIIEKLASLTADDYRLVVLARGGGDPLELSLLDRADICQAISQCPVPVIIAVGHREDAVAAERYAAFRYNVPAQAGHTLKLIGTRDEGMRNHHAERERELENHISDLEASVAARDAVLAQTQARADSLADTLTKLTVHEKAERDRIWWAAVTAHAIELRIRGSWMAVLASSLATALLWESNAVQDLLNNTTPPSHSIDLVRVVLALVLACTALFLVGSNWPRLTNPAGHPQTPGIDQVVRTRSVRALNRCLNADATPP